MTQLIAFLIAICAAAAASDGRSVRVPPTLAAPAPSSADSPTGR